MKFILKKRCAFQTPISAALAVAFIGIFFAALFHQIPLLLVSLAIAIALIVWIHCVYAKDGFSLSETDCKLLWFLSAVFAILCISLTCFGIRSILADEKASIAVASLLTALVFGLLTAFEGWYIKQARVALEIRFDWKNIWRVAAPIGALCTLLVVLNLEIFTAWIRWDSFDYFYYINRLSYTTFENLETLRLANHAAYGASILYIILDGIIGNMAITIYALNLLLLVLGTIMFWGLLKTFFPSWSMVCRLLVTCIYAFSPFLFGMVYAISLETFMMFGLLLYFWGEAREIPVAQTAGALFICFSKETGTVLLFAIMAVRVLSQLFGKKQKDIPFLKRPDYAVLVPIVGYALLWLYDLGTFNWSTSNQPTSTSGAIEELDFNSFAFNPTFIADRLKSLLFSNFTWLIILVLVAGASILLWRKLRGATVPSNLFVMECLAALSVGLVTLLLFVTYNHIRYAAPVVLLLLLLLPFAINNLNLHKPRVVVSCVLAFCCFAQCYATVDPAMHLFFQTLDKGAAGKLAYSENNILSDELNPTVICVNTQYNREIMYFDRAFDRLIQNIGYDNDTCIVISAEYFQQSVKECVLAEYLILGFGYQYMDDPYYASWDFARGIRYLSKTKSENQMNIRFAASAQDMNNLLNTYERVVYLQLPFRDTDYEQSLLDGFDCTVAGEGFCNGWSLIAFEVTKR